jgi:hypothetical protein
MESVSMCPLMHVSHVACCDSDYKPAGRTQETLSWNAVGDLPESETAISVQ